eukprot:379698-Pyramimonas_sp.AAC.1
MKAMQAALAEADPSFDDDHAMVNYKKIVRTRMEALRLWLGSAGQARAVDEYPSSSPMLATPVKRQSTSEQLDEQQIVASEEPAKGGGKARDGKDDEKKHDGNNKGSDSQDNSKDTPD